MAKVLNNLLCCAMIFSLTFVWTVYCLKDAKIALFLAAVVAACSFYIIFVILTKWQKKKNVKTKKKKTIKDFAIFLQFYSDTAELFMPMLCYYNFTTEKVDFDNLIISKEQRIFVAICFQNDSVTFGQIQKAIVEAKRAGCEKLMIFGNKADNGIVAFANSQFNCRFIDAANTYELFERAEKLPQIPKQKLPKRSFLPQFAFSKKRFGWYFFGAVFTLVTAIFSYFKLYLLIWSTVLLCLALYSLFNKRFNTQPTEVTLK